MALTNQVTDIVSPAEEHMDGVDRAHPVRLPIASLMLGGLSCIGMLASIWLIFFYTPIDALQGETQRIFYFHVPTAWVGMLGFVVMTVAGIIYLIRPDERLDWIAHASSEVGAVFLT
ncbi:MAG TPA: cytochrome c biogenesis protein CcsA, partial [Ktedonobacteraceae bacterium]|nr:cytochrome c biogenesis protein CcsA [Ktedonobacteraceae bacterium]